MSQDVSGGQRLTRAAREQQIIEGAAALVVEHGCLPLPLETLSQRVGVSKALVYAYFPTQQDLANRILLGCLESLVDAVEAAFAARSPRETARRCAEAYFDHVSRHGRLLHMLLSDPVAAGGTAAEVRSRYSRIMRRLSAGLRDGFGVPTRDCLAAVQIVAALAEDAGEQVFTGRLDRNLGRRLAMELTDGALCDLADRLQRLAPAPAAN